MKIKGATIILLILTLYGVEYFIFERLFFFNEILSLIGLTIFIKNCLRPNYKFKIPVNTIYQCVLLFILLGGIYAVVSLYFMTNWYYYFRGLSIIYSIFSFFIGYYLYEQQFYYFTRFRKLFYGFSIMTFAWINPVLFDRSVFTYWFSLLQKNWKAGSVVIFVILFLIYIAVYTSFTVLIVLFVILGIRFLKSYARFKLVAITIALAFGVMLFAAAPYLKLYHHGSYSLFGDVSFVYEHHPLFQIDPNSSWRLILWYRIIVENFPQNLIGIGLGTPIIPYVPIISTTTIGFNDEYLAHVIGVHNTYITIFARFGFLSVVFFGIIYRTIFREYFIYKPYYLLNKNDSGLFLSFFAITTLGLFNLVIESPTLASLYWVSLGFVAKAISNRKMTMVEKKSIAETSGESIH